MPTVSIAEAAENFTELVHKLQSEPLLVMDGDEEVAIITSPAAVERERQARWREFWKKRDAVAAEFEANLAKDGLTVEEFLADVLKDV